MIKQNYLPHNGEMTYETDWLKVGTAGATVDGRIIKEEWLTEMADLYDPKNEYKAQIWAWSHWNHYQTYGKVLDVKAEKDDKGRLSCYVKISPLPELIALNRAGQLQHTSMEIHPNYKRDGKAYLTGLLFTNDPASVGTEEVNLSKDNPDKEDQAIFTAAFEFSDEFKDVSQQTENNNSESDSDDEPPWFKRAINKYFGKKPEDEDEMTEQDFDKVAELFATATASLKEELVAEVVEKLSKNKDADDAGAGADQTDQPPAKTELEVATEALSAEQAKTVALQADLDAEKAKVNELSKEGGDNNSDDPDNFGSNQDNDQEFMG